MHLVSAHLVLRTYTLLQIIIKIKTGTPTASSSAEKHNIQGLFKILFKQSLMNF